MSRPRKNCKSKSRNGSGTVTNTIQKISRGKNRKKEMCKICTQCTDRSICDNRKGNKKCKKCLECVDKNCDRFYIYDKIKAFSSRASGKRQYIGQFETKKEAQTSIIKKENGGFINKSNITLLQILEKNNEERLRANNINENTYSRNKSVQKQIEKYGLGNKKIQKITSQEVQDIFNEMTTSYSQSSIEKIKYELNSAFKYAIRYKYLTDNPLQDIMTVYSEISTKSARPFNINEQNQLLDYLENSTLLTDIRSKMDSITFKNIVRLAFISGQRIGEILALKYDDVDFDRETFSISKTITRNTKGKFIVGNKTKNSKKRIHNREGDNREISFHIATGNEIRDIFLEQIEHSKKFLENNEHFVFCNINGTFITPSQVTTTLKNICRKLHIQLNNEKGCYIHQARHSFVTRCLEAGMRIDTIAKLIGDTVEQVRKTYAHILPQFENEELELLHTYYKNKNIKI